MNIKIYIKKKLYFAPKQQYFSPVSFKTHTYADEWMDGWMDVNITVLI